MAEPKEEKSLAMSPFQYLRVILDVIVIIVMMFGVRGLIPDLLFYSILSILGFIVFLALLNMYGESWTTKIDTWQRERKRNNIAKENFGDLEDHIEKFRPATYPLRGVRDRLRDQLRTLIKEKQMEEFGLLPVYLIESLHLDLENRVFSIKRRLERFNGTFTDFFSFIRELELTMEDFSSSVQFLSVFAREMTRIAEIDKRTETEYEEFRERYNSFLDDYKKFAHKLNRDLGESVFMEYFHPIRKWRRIS